MRDDETARAPKSPPRAMDFEAGLDAQGNVVAWKGEFHMALNHIPAFKLLDFPLLAATDVGQSKPGDWVRHNAGANAGNIMRAACSRLSAAHSWRRSTERGPRSRVSTGPVIRFCALPMRPRSRWC